MKITLCMIVRDEEHVIERCLRSLLPIIDNWVISDTGSKDQTKEIIRKVLKDVPGKLFEDEWVHFAHNRTLAIQRAKGRGDFILMMDADHEWHGTLPDVLPNDVYQIEHRYAGTVYGIPILMRASLDWHYECPIHETVVCKDAGPAGALIGSPWVQVFHEGARSRDPDTYKKDAAILLKHVAEHPDDCRATYYLAQSFWNSGDHKSAREWYVRRGNMEGWVEERWHARYRAAQMLEAMGAHEQMVYAEYMLAYQFYPSRSEPLVAAARLAASKGHHGLAAMFSRQAMMIPRPASGLFVEAAIYDWIAADLFSVAAYYAGLKEEGLSVARTLLACPALPQEHKTRVAQNIGHFEALKEAA